MKIIVLGDSISEGIGSKKINYSQIIELRYPEYKINNLSKSGTTVVYAHSITEEIDAYNPDTIIIFYGHVDAMPRPKSTTYLYKILPSRYKKNGMLNPRALYTSKKPKRYFQIADSIFRVLINKLLIMFLGYEQWNERDNFEYYYSQLLERYIGKNIIMLSTVPIYDRWFPYANEEFRKYDEIIVKLSNIYNCKYINTFQLLSKYPKEEVFAYDYFHLSKKGYEIIADEIIKLL